MWSDSWLQCVNMTNCSNQRRAFFEKYGSIDTTLLISYWMMAGYLDPFESVKEGYEAGFKILMGLKRKGILSESLNKVSASTSADLNRCGHKRQCTASNPGFDDLLDLRQLARLTLADGVLKDQTGSLLLLDGSQILESALSFSRKFKYIACFRSHPESIKVLLENIDNPSLLMLRDYGLFPKVNFSFEKIPSLTVLEISGSSHLTVNTAELTRLQCLNLSGTGTEEFPEDFFSKLEQLRWLVLRGCRYLKRLPSLNSLINLEVLDLNGSRRLGSLPFGTTSSPKLRILECCGTAMTSIPRLETTQLTHLLMSNSKLGAFAPIKHPRSIQLLDLSNASLQRVDLSQLDDLQAVDLSHTGISTIDSVEDKVHLRKLILKGCAIEKLPALDKLESLEVLDVSQCTQLIHPPDLSNQKKLEVLDLSKTQINHLPSFPNPSRLWKLSLRELELGSLETLSSQTGLVELDLSKVKISSSGGFKVDFLESLLNLQTLNLSHTCVVDLPALINHTKLKELFLAGCQHLNTLPDVNTLINLDKLLLNDILKSSQSDGDERIEKITSTLLAKIEQDLEFAAGAATLANSNGNTHTRQLRKVKMDLECIKEQEERLMKSPNFGKVRNILQHMMQLQHPRHLPELVQTVARLKLLLPRTQIYDSESSVRIEKKEPKFVTTSYNIKKLVIPEATHVQMERFLSSYKSLTSDERHCLLCFSIFPLNVHDGNHKEILLGKSLEIKKQMLIYWWAGEGFINIHSEQVTSDDKGKLKKTIEETGEDILRVLADKGFIQPVIRKSRETRRCSMNTIVHTFVTQQAKQEKFFNFSKKSGKLTPLLKSSHRACFLRSQDPVPSSCQFWAVYAKSPDKLKRLKMVKTLFNVDESVIHIQPEWFSEMRDLYVLQLGNWHCEHPEHIEVREKTFMEDLKKMKQLKFFSLQGVSTIERLPKSACQLTNLMILDLKECHDLEELPGEIGSLKNLTHLDISNCHFLTMLPRGLRLLSKLEVLKGFVMYEQPSGPQDKKENILSRSCKGHRIHDFLRSKKNEACTFRDLLQLQNLRKLSIVVNNEKFPDSKELEVLKQMENLLKLKIFWRRNLKQEKKSYSSVQTEVDQGEHKTPAHDQGENMNVEKKPGREFLDQIEKLELWDFPNNTAPDWLVPDQLENLKKLYIRGGKLEKLPEGSSSKVWNVTTLRFRYLADLTITWDALRAMFPKMTYLDKRKCKKLHFFPCDDEGVWVIDYE